MPTWEVYVNRMAGRKAVDPALVRPGTMIELLGPCYGVDDAAADAGTIGYEILTSLGARYHRVYRQPVVADPSE